MTLTKLSLGGNSSLTKLFLGGNNLIIPAQGIDIPAGDEKMANLF
jgi:hypothetical protein